MIIMDHNERKNLIPEWGISIVRKLDALIYENPTKDVLSQMNDFFEQSKQKIAIPIEEKEFDTYWTVDVHIPNVKKEQIKVTYNDKTMTIAIVHKEETEQYDQQNRFYHKEQKEYLRERTIRIPTDGEIDKVKATFTNGLLRVRIPKK